MNRPRRSGSARKPEKSLSASDWIALASELLVKNNGHGVEIAELCKRLGVTKGSFYWHFEDRRDLLWAILEEWRRDMTIDVVTRLNRVGTSVAGTLHRVLGLIRKPRSEGEGVIERSVRDWARSDREVHDAVVGVDQTRLAYFEGLLRKYGFTEKEAHLRAYTAYAVMMGDSILKETIEPRYPDADYLDKFVQLLLLNDAQAVIVRESAPSEPAVVSDKPMV